MLGAFSCSPMISDQLSQEGPRNDSASFEKRGKSRLAWLLFVSCCMMPLLQNHSPSHDFQFFPVFQVRRPRCSCTAPWCPCLRQTPSHYFQLFFSIFLVRSPCSSCAASWFPCLHQSCSAMLHVPICNCRSRCAQV